jgi:micrococcal nuclease
MKKFVNWLPIIAIVLLIGAYWQMQSRVDYESGTTARAAKPKMGQSQHYENVTVLDGDTIALPTGERVRFCGIDAPEIAHGSKPGQPLGEESRQKLRSIIAAGGGEVIVSPAERDKYGRLVAEVFVPTANPDVEVDVNYEMVRSGMAYHYAQYSDRCPNGGDAYVEAETLAKAKRLGVWASDNQKPWDFRKAQR